MSFQSYEDVLEQGLTLYYWSDTIMEQDLKHGTNGPAAHELYENGKGVASGLEAVEAVKADKGTQQILHQI